ncbi:N-acetyltransferase, partial [Streptosporangium algeriense]
MTVVRPFQPADTTQMALTMARAFADYPFTVWSVQADDRHERLRGLYTLYVAEFSASLGGAWVTDDCAAVASWVPPGVTGP